MPLYLSPFIGSGTRIDPYRPKYSDDVGGWACTDLRADASNQAGFALLWTPNALPNRVDLRQLADAQRETLTVGRRVELGNALGVTLDVANDRIDTILARMFFRPMGAGRWNQVQISTLRWCKEIEFHGQVWARENVAPGTPSTMDPEDQFNRANENPLAGNWSTPGGWGNLQLIDNAVAAATNNTNACARWIADSFANDQWSRVLASTLGTNTDWGPAVRIRATGVKNAYVASAYQADEQLFKFVADSYTRLAGITTANVTTADEVEARIEGSTLRWVKNGAVQGSTTDTSLADGSAGIFCYKSDARLTWWKGGDLAALLVRPPDAHADIPVAYFAPYSLARLDTPPNVAALLSGGGIYDETLSLAQINGLISATELTIAASVVLGINQAQIIIAAMDMDDAISLSAQLAITSAGGSDFGESLTLAIQQASAQGDALEMNPALTLAIQQATDATTSLDAAAAVVLGLNQAVIASATADIEAALTLAVQQAIAADTGNVFNESLALGLLHATTITTQSDVVGNVSIDLTLSAEAQSMAVFDTAVPLNQALAVSLIGQAVLSAGLTLSAIQSVTTNGTTVIIEAITPAGRTLTIKIDARVVMIEAENRTFTIQ